MSKKASYTVEFKEGAIRMVEEGLTCAEAGRRLGVPATNISRWIREQDLSLSKKNTKPLSNQESLEERNKALEKEIKQLRMEREILKKAATFFANEK